MEEEGKGPLQPALCRERLGAPRPSPAGRSGGRGDPSLVGAGPSSHCAGGRHRKGLRAAGAQHPPHTAGLTGPLLHQRPGGSEEADNSGSSAFPAIPVPGLGLRRQTGVRKGARGAGRGQPAGGGLGGGGPLPGKPLLLPRSPGLKSKFGASRAGARRPGPSASRPRAKEPEAAAGLAQAERTRPGEAALSTRTLRDTVGPTASAPPPQGAAQGSPGQDLGPAGDERSAVAAGGAARLTFSWRMCFSRRSSR